MAVLFIAPTYQQIPILVYSLQVQTHPDWHLILMHDGPNEAFKAKMLALNEPRISYSETNMRVNDWGHTLRHFCLEEIKNKNIGGGLYCYYKR